MDILGDIAGLDPAQGIKYCGSEAGWMTILESFTSSLPDTLDEINLCRDEGRWEDYSRLVHGIKSTMRAIGMDGLCDVAARLEQAGRQQDMDLISAENDSFIASCRKLCQEAEPAFSEDRGDIPEASNEAGITDDPETAYDKDASLDFLKNIIFIHSEKNFATQAITTHLKDDGFNIHHAEELISDIETKKSKADIILYYLSGISSNTMKLEEYLRLLCTNDKKTLALIGDGLSLTDAQGVIGEENIRLSYTRPLDIRQLVCDMNTYYEAYRQLRIQKLILVVDDNPDFLQLLKSWLHPRYMVDMVSSGEEALKYLQDHTPDLILLDYEMPQMDGPEVMENIKQDHSLSRIPIIFLTGRDDRQAVMHVLEKKPDGYILKSTGKEGFMAAIDGFFVKQIMGSVKTKSIRKK